MTEDTLGAADRAPLRGGAQEAALWPNDLRKQGGRQRRPGASEACAGNSDGSSALPAAFELPGELGKGAQAPGLSASPDR